MLPPAPKLGVLQPRSGWNATSLAFLGDAVWEVCGRQRGKMLLPLRPRLYLDRVHPICNSESSMTVRRQCKVHCIGPSCPHALHVRLRLLCVTQL